MTMGMVFPHMAKVIFIFLLFSLSFNRTANSSKLCVPINQQTVNIGPVAAAGSAGAAEETAAPPSEPKPCAQHRTARHHGSLHPIPLFLKAPTIRSVSALHSPGSLYLQPFNPTPSPHNTHPGPANPLNVSGVTLGSDDSKE